MEIPNGGEAIELAGAKQPVKIKKNAIAFNKKAGTHDPNTVAKQIDPNTVFGNVGLGIDNGTTAGTPVLTSAVQSNNTTQIQGTLSATPNATYYLEFFGNSVASAADAQGEFFLGSTTVTTDASGNASFNVTFNAAYGNYVTATATNTAPDGYTSEFSTAVAVTGAPGTAAVGSRAWDDYNGNGIQDPGEVGFPNVTVQLYTSAGALVASTTTASDGSYWFQGIAPGDYYLQFTAPAGYSFSPEYQDDFNDDSEVDPTTGQTAVFTLIGGEVDPYLDAGLMPGSMPAPPGPGSPPAPTLTGGGCDSGPAYGGREFVLWGSNFTDVNTVTFGNVILTNAGPSDAQSLGLTDVVPNGFQVLSDNVIELITPSQPAGTVNVTVSSPSGTSAALTYTYTPVPAPAITTLSANTSSTAGGTLVEINGSGFTDASEVDFGNQPVYDFTVNSDSQITAVAPPNYTGTVDVTVSNGTGASAAVSADRFTYTGASIPAVTGLDTTSGSTAGGTTVNLSGSGFTGALGVTIGGVAAAFTVNSDSSITAVAPSQAAGTVDVTVTTFSGTSASTSADRFTYTSAGAPTVTSLATNSGTTAGGTLVGITGSGFTGATAVSFGSVPATSFTVASDTLLTALAPPQAAGIVDVTVSTYDGTSGTGTADQFTYSNAAVPAITGLTPATGTTAGGAVVTILGSGFTGATGVSFGSLPAASFTVNSDTSITAVSPMTAAGTVDVRVTTYSGTSPVVTADQFTTTNLTAPAPSVTGISPNTGSTGGGQVVTITGSNFTGATGVSFGGTAAASFSILSDGTLTATAPAGTAGTVDITVTTNNGTSTTGAADQFTYLSTPAPSIASLTPNSGTSAGGASVSIGGSNFTNASAVLFGTTPATNFTVNSDSSITATAPPLPAGSYGVTVTTPSGTSASSSFTVTAAAVPTLTNLGTTSGTTAGGTSVTITGTGFTGAQSVSFGGVAATSFTVNSDASITATSPPQNAGTVDVSVSTYAGTTANSTADRFTYTLAALPAVTTLGTTSGSTGGGTAVTINGSGFTGATAVMFGNVAASSFTVVSDTQISAISPAQAAGIVDVQVTTYSGSSTEVSGDQFTYTAAAVPSVTSLGTTTGTTAGGTAVLINGSGFAGATSVNFGSVGASFSVLSDTQISAIAPAQTAGTVDVQVTSYSGTSLTSPSDQFTYTNAPAPVVGGVSANSGTAAGGTLVTITGSGFTSATGVNFGANPTDDFTVLSDNALLATAPAGTAGTVDITVTTYSGTSTTGSADQFTYNAVTAPTVTGVSPSSGSSGGGSLVTISGSGFLGSSGGGADEVSFGDTPATSFSILNDSTISAVAPPMPAGTADVTVATDGITSALVNADQFTVNAASAPVVSSLSPASGSTAGGTSVTISGSNFTGADSVSFGGVAAASFTVNSDTSLTAVAPSQAAGTVDVVVGTPSGSSATGTADQFTYTNAPAPVVSGLSLTSGSSGGGPLVTVAGSGFTGATAVYVGSVAVDFTVEADGWLVAAAPPQAAGVLDVTVTTPSGTSATSSADQFTYNAAPAPMVNSISPNNGPTSDSTFIVVSGSGFPGASDVYFGSTEATSFSVVCDDTLLVELRAPAGPGTGDITVVTPSGTSGTGPGDQFTFTSQDDAPLTAVTGINFSVTVGTVFHGNVASFTDTDTSGSASQFSAVIYWGNGTRTMAGIVPNGYNGSGQPQFLVTSQMSYSSVGQYTITVSIQDAGGASAETTATATVTNPPQAPSQPAPAASGTTATATHGVAFHGSVATFHGLAGASYLAVINWGNGWATAGSIVATSPTTYSVVGSNTYVTPGVYTVSITISMVGGGSTTVETTITVADATLPETDESESLPADEPPRAPAVAVAGLAHEEAADDTFWELGWLLDLGGQEEGSLDPRCVDAVLMAAANRSGEEQPPDGEVEPTLAVLDEGFAVD